LKIPILRRLTRRGLGRVALPIANCRLPIPGRPGVGGWVLMAAAGRLGMVGGWGLLGFWRFVIGECSRKHAIARLGPPWPARRVGGAWVGGGQLFREVGRNPKPCYSHFVRSDSWSSRSFLLLSWWSRSSSRKPSGPVIRKNSVRRGSNCVPEQRRISVRATSSGSALR